MTNGNAATLAQLTELVAPPERPLRTADAGNWQKLTDTIDFPFADSFLDYGRTYGTGEIEAAGYAVQIGNPLDPKFPKWVLEQSGIMRTRGDGPDLRKTRFYPEANGVLPFASNLSGDLVFFTQEGTIVSCPTDPSILIPYRCDLIGFLCALFSGKLSPEYFPNSEMCEDTPEFTKTAWM